MSSSRSPPLASHPAKKEVQGLTPKSTNTPNISTPNPTNGHLIKINSTPAQNASVPFHLFLLAKKTNVRWGPSRRVMPMRKRMLPMASRARSKKRMRPKRKKKPPPLQKATPISGRGHYVSRLGAGWSFRRVVSIAVGDVLCESESHIVGMIGEILGERGCARMRWEIIVA